MKVLVTGGGGFLGQAVVRQLLARGNEVAIINRRAYPALTARGVQAWQGDIADPRAVLKAAEGVQAIVHVAARAGPGLRRQAFYQANVVGTRNVLDACRVHGIRYLVHTSSPSVVHGGGDLENADEGLAYAEKFHAPYPETKAEAERLVLKASRGDFRACALRPHLIWGPGDNQLLPRLIEKARAGRLRLPAPDKRIDTTYIDNAATAHVLALDELAGQGRCAGKAYFISNGEPLPVGEILSRLLEAAGEKPDIGTVNPKLAMAAAGLVEGVWRALGREADPPLSRFVVEHLSTAHWYNLSAARRDLGYEPAISISEGLERLRAAWGKSILED